MNDVNICTIQRNVKENSEVESIIKVSDSLFHVSSYYNSQGDLQDILIVIAQEGINRNAFSTKNNDETDGLLYNEVGS